MMSWFNRHIKPTSSLEKRYLVCPGSFFKKSTNPHAIAIEEPTGIQIVAKCSICGMKLTVIKEIWQKLRTKKEIMDFLPSLNLPDLTIDKCSCSTETLWAKGCICKSN